MKYTILKIRHKISYSAFLEKKTIPELLIGQILTTYRMLQRNKVIPINDMKDYQNELVFRSMMNNDLGMLKTIMAQNLNFENPE